MTNKPRTDIDQAHLEQISSKSVLTIDYARYEKYLENADLSEDQKQAFLDALWSIIVGFVDLGFGVHPLQQAAPTIGDQELCGHIAKTAMADSAAMLSSECSLPKQEFASASEDHRDQSAPKE